MGWMIFLLMLSTVWPLAAPGEVYFQAHRGGLNEAPENTLAAFERAWDISGAVPEVDLRTTQDGVIVCIHDPTPARTTNAPDPWASTPIREIPYEMLSQWDAGSHFDSAYAGERIPTLRQLFERMQGHPDRQLYLDLKDVDLDALLGLIEEYRLKAQVLFVHGDPEMCVKLFQSYPGARTMTWLSGDPETIKQRYAHLAADGFTGISQLQFHLHAAQEAPEIVFALDELFLYDAVRRTRAAGVELQLRPFAFDPPSLRRLLELGVRWYVTDNPRAFSEAVAEAGFSAETDRSGDSR